MVEVTSPLPYQFLTNAAKPLQISRSDFMTFPEHGYRLQNGKTIFEYLCTPFTNMSDENRKYNWKTR